MTRDSCIVALTRYRTQLAHLARVISTAPPHETAHAESHVEDLRFQLDVDVGARATPDGEARMSAVERELFAPALRVLRDAVRNQLVRHASAQWLPAILELQATLDRTLERAAHWQPEAG